MKIRDKLKETERDKKRINEVREQKREKERGRETRESKESAQRMIGTVNAIKRCVWTIAQSTNYIDIMYKGFVCSQQRHALTVIYFHHSDATAYFMHFSYERPYSIWLHKMCIVYIYVLECLCPLCVRLWIAHWWAFRLFVFLFVYLVSMNCVHVK